jgi:hypothetical membrane protein
VPGSTRVFALCGVAAPVFYVVGTLLAASLRPDYSLAVHTVSRLGETGAPYALLFNYVGLVPVGILTAVFALAILRALPGGRAVRIGAVLLALEGVALVASSALFPRLSGPSPGALHLGASVIALACGMLAGLTLARPLGYLGSGYGLLSVAVAIAVPVLFVVVAPNAPTPGLYHRLGTAFAFIWMLAVAIPIIRGAEAG